MLLVGCGPDRNSWMAREYQNTTARYNRYYNGQVILDETVRGVKESHVDDFNKIISIYPYGTAENLTSNSGQMDEILKKSAHTLIKHPKSKWIDDTYILIGKSHFFRGDFFSAIDVFDYVYSTYRDKEIKDEAQLWILKSYIQLEKYLEAEALYGKIKLNEEMSKRLKGHMELAGAAIALSQNKNQTAIDHLEKALPRLKKKKDDKYRYHYILAQLYEASGNSDSAIDNYEIVIKSNPPYEFEFNAKLSSAKLLGAGEGGNKAESKLKKMLKDDKNIDFFDQIYYELAKIKHQEGKSNQAIKYYEQSIATSKRNAVQKSNSYLALGELYFQVPNYEKAQHYYDSASIFLEESHPKFESISRRSEVLSDLIEHLISVYTNDSLLRLSNDPDYLKKMVDAKIDEEKIKRERGIEDEDDFNPFQNNNNNQNLVTTTSNFPFYNPVAKAKGYNEFVAKWGKRPETDNWRISSIQTLDDNLDQNSDDMDSAALDSLQEQMPDVPEDRRKYYVGIPFTPAAKKEANEKIESSLFESGRIYKERLEDYEEAIKSFEELVKRYPESMLKPSVYYYLIQCFETLGDQANRDKYFNMLQSEYPDSRYTYIMNNPDGGDLDSDTTVVQTTESEKYYLSMFELYKSEKYDSALVYKNLHDEEYPGDALQMQFDYLLALIYGRKGDMENYESQLKFVAEEYQNTAIGKDAQDKLNAILYRRNPELKEQDKEEELFVNEGLEGGFCIMLVGDVSNINGLKSDLSDFNKNEFRLEKLVVTSFLFSSTEYLVIIKNHSSEKNLTEYVARLAGNKPMSEKFKINSENVVHISKKNFDALLKDKDFEKYKVFYKANF
jgi:tetratricopeptide (TPR) repeat protein